VIDTFAGGDGDGERSLSGHAEDEERLVQRGRDPLEDDEPGEFPLA
jgi:hypothetical protein